MSSALTIAGSAREAQAWDDKRAQRKDTWNKVLFEVFFFKRLFLRARIFCRIDIAHVI